MNKRTDSLTMENVRIQTLLEHVNVGVVIHAPDTSILLANKEASRILGLSIEQLQGKVAVDQEWYFTNKDGSELPHDEYPVAKIASTLQSFENHVGGVYRTNLKDQVWVKVNGYPEIDNHGQLKYIVITFVDITTQIESQKALIDISERKNTENEINTLFEIVQGVVQTSDLHELLKLIHHSLKKVLYAENCFFALYDANTGLFNFPYFVDQYDDVIEPKALFKSCTAYVFRTGKSMLIPQEVFEKLSKLNEVELVVRRRQAGLVSH